MPPALRPRFAAAQAHLLVVVARPTRTGCIGGEPIAQHLCLVLRSPRGLAAQQVQRIVRREDVGDITEIDAGDKLFGRHIAEQLPQRLALDFGPQIPDRVDHCRGRHVNDALLRPDPAQLAITCHMPPEGAYQP